MGCNVPCLDEVGCIKFERALIRSRGNLSGTLRGYDMKNLIRLQILGAFVTLLLIGTNATADKRNIPKAVQAAVEDLTVCYARGTDSFGRAVGATAVPSDPEDPVNTADPDFAAGLALYARVLVQRLFVQSRGARSGSCDDTGSGRGCRPRWGVAVGELRQ